MKRRTTILLALIVLMLASSRPAAAQNRYIVQTNGGLSSVLNLCNLLGCQVQGSLDGQVGKTYLVQDTTPVEVPVGPETLGRVLNVIGEPVDEMGPVNAKKHYPIHRPAPSFEDQSTVIEQIAFWIALVVFLSMGGHREIITAVVYSYQKIPIGSGGLDSQVMLATLLGAMVSGSAVRESWLSLTRASTPTTPFFVQFFSQATTSRETSQVPPNGSTWRGRMITIRGRTSRLASFSNRLPPFWINPRRPFWTVLPMLPLDTER